MRSANFAILLFLFIYIRPSFAMLDTVVKTSDSAIELRMLREEHDVLFARLADQAKQLRDRQARSDRARAHDEEDVALKTAISNNQRELQLIKKKIQTALKRWEETKVRKGAPPEPFRSKDTFVKLYVDGQLTIGKILQWAKNEPLVQVVYRMQKREKFKEWSWEHEITLHYELFELPIAQDRGTVVGDFHVGEPIRIPFGSQDITGRILAIFQQGDIVAKTFGDGETLYVRQGKYIKSKTRTNLEWCKDNLVPRIWPFTR